jgi:hypothetical protein
MAYPSRKPAQCFLDSYFFLATDDPTAPDRFIALGFSRLARLHFVVHIERGEKVRIISVRRASRSERKPMSNDETTPVEPSEASLAEMPEVDFSRAIRPNKLAALRGDFQQAVFLDNDLWQHFGNEERVLEALRMLVSLAERSSRSVA